MDKEELPVIMKVLFETPSGFAIFACDAGYLYEDNRLQSLWVYCVSGRTAKRFIWLKGFRKFKNKSIAINPISGINKRLAKFINKWCKRGEILVVGEPAYKEAIEDKLGITCRYDEGAMELMWGLQNLLHTLVPEEKSEFSKQDRKYYSKKLLAFLHGYDPNIKHEMINGRIALAACFLYRCSVFNKEYSVSLHSADGELEKIGLKTDGWDEVTYATALMKMCGEPVLIPDEMFREEEKEKIFAGIGKYDDKIIKGSLETIYHEAVRVNRIISIKQDELEILFTEAKEAWERARESQEVLGELPQWSSEKKRSHQEDAEAAEVGVDADGQRRKKLKVDDCADVVQSGATME